MSSKHYKIMIRTKVPSGWSDWRIHDSAHDLTKAQILLDKYEHKKGYDRDRFQFKIKEPNK